MCIEEKMCVEEKQKERIYALDDVLRTIYLGCTERAIKSLFFINAGGVVTILTYLHQSDSLALAKILLNVSWIFFLVGLSTAFTIVVIDYFMSLADMDNFRDDVKRFYLGEISFLEIRESRREDRSFWFEVEKRIGIVSAICFVIGVVCGICGYFSN